MFRLFRKKRINTTLMQEHFLKSQQTLLEAALSTSLAAQDVTKTLKDSLVDSKKQFEGTAKILEDALFLCDLDGTINSFNPASIRIFGIEDFANINIVEILEGIDKDNLWTSMMDQRYTTGLKSKSHMGNKWVEPSITQLDWSDGSASMLVLIKDMDDSVAQTSQTRSMFESAFDGIVIEQNDQIMAANPAIVKLFGYATSELLDRPISILFGPNDCVRVEYPTDYSEIECDGIASEGNVLKLAVSITKISWRGKDAHLLTIKDITDFRRFERISSRDNGIDFVCCFNKDFKITFVNTLFARNYKSTRNALIGKDIRLIIGEDDKNHLQTNVAKLSPSSPSNRIQTERNGKLVDWIDHAIFDNDGQIIEYHRIGRDVTDIMKW